MKHNANYWTMKSTIERLEEALIHNSDFDNDPDLVAAAGEALGQLKALGSLSFAELLYDMTRLAGMAGQYPEDFDKKVMTNFQAPARRVGED